MSEILHQSMQNGDNLVKILRQLDKFNPWTEMLRKYIQTTNIQQNNLAEQIGVSPSTIHMWCKGKRMPDGQKVELLISAFNLSEEKAYLFTSAWLKTIRIRNLRPMLELADQQKNKKRVANILKDFMTDINDYK